MKLANADIVPTEIDLRPEYASCAELEVADQMFMDEVNHREHRATRRRPADVLAEEAPGLHVTVDAAHTAVIRRPRPRFGFISDEARKDGGKRCGFGS